MRLLLDTHALLWGLLADTRLSRLAGEAMLSPENDIVVSAVSIFEVTLKYRLGKLDEAAGFVRRHEQVMRDLEWISLPVSVEHAALAGSMDIAHKDPFDRLLIAQALVERVPLVSNETLFDGFGIERIW